MAVGFSNTNKPINPRGNDASPKGYNRAALYSGKALDFDGVNDYVDAGTLDITGYTAISISAYVKVDSFASTSVPLSIQHTGSDDVRIVFTSTGKIELGVDDGTYYRVLTDAKTNEWYFATLTFDGTTLKGYLNGVEFDSMAASFDFSTASGVVNLGQRVGGSFLYNGQIANVKVFNTALTAAQVADLYNNPEKVVPTGVADSALKLWLPMMEGANTTAYDGSGNGNHGTISGATWTHGIGSPVAQTAVIDWNKGTNELLQSNNFDNASWGNINLTIESGQTGFDGTNNAFRFKTSNTNGAFYVEQSSALTSQNVFSVYAKADGYDYLFLFNSNTGKGKFYNLANGTLASDYGSAPDDSSIISIGDGWYKCTLTNTPAAASSFRMFVSNQDGVFIYQGDGTSGILVQHSQVQIGTDIGPYVETLTTRQSSPVLLPQGLTTGRDITGVNLFENVRKQGALNLDGNSWAEVHDNASLDITDAITLEAWVYLDSAPVDNVDSMHSLMTKKSASVTDSEAAFDIRATGANGSIAITGGFDTGALQTINIATGLSIEQWYHILITYDSGSVVTYLNGAQVNTGSMLSPIIANAYDVWIGRHVNAGGLNSYAEADIAQPRIYNRALTAAEVLQNYNSGKSIYTNS